MSQDGEFKVLIVEDDLVSQKLLVSVLNKITTHVFTAANSDEALKWLETDFYDLIIMDIQLPGISGIEITRQIRRKESGTKRHSLIIALTGLSSPDDKKNCLDCGMNGFFTKPLNRQRFLDFLRKLIKKV